MKVVYLGLVELQTVKIIVLAYQAWQRKFKVFKCSKIFGVSRFSFELKNQLEKNKTAENLQNLVSVANKWVGNIFVGPNWSFRWKNSKMFHLDRDLFSRKQRKSRGAIFWEN